MNKFESTNELTHYGILGMKWGVRRAQKRELLKGAARNRRDIDTHDKALAKLDRTALTL